MYVVDASVVIKWFIPEKFSTEALRIHSGGTPLHAPAFLDIEVANIAWKKLRRGEITRPNADFILAQRLVLPLTRHPDDALIVPAFDIADQTQRTVYDCLYLALAVRLGGQMVTADAKLVNSLAGTPWAGAALAVQNVP